MSEEEIQKMVKDAELNAEEDKKARELVEEKNELEGLTYSLEKSLGELGDKLPPHEKQLAEDEVKRAREAVASDDLNRIRSAKESLQQFAQKLGASASQSPNGEGSPQGGSEAKDDGKVVDADYTVVDDDKK